MPEQIELDGVVSDYYSKDEYDSLQQKLAELEESSNPNWAEARNKIKILEDENAKYRKLEAQGKSVDDDGNVVEKQMSLTAEQIRAEAKQAAIDELINERKAELFSQFDDESRQVVETYFNKLSAGEQITIRNVSDYVNQASVLAQPNRRGTVAVGGEGSGPRPSFQQKSDFAESNEGKDLAANMGLKI